MSEKELAGRMTPRPGVRRIGGAVDVSTLLEYALRLALAFIFTRARIFGVLSPFALSFLGAGAAGISGALTLIGALFGYLLSGDLIWSLKYICACVLVWAAMFVFRDSRFSKHPLFGPVTTLAMLFCVSFVYTSHSGWNAVNTALFAAELVVAGLAAAFYREAFSPYSGDARGALGVFAVFATTLMGLAGVTLFDFVSVGRTAAVFTVALCAWRNGVSGGALAGASLGAVLDLAFGGTPVFTVIYAVTGIVSGIFSQRGRVLFAAAFIVTNATVVLCMWRLSPNISPLYEAFLASVAITVLPAEALSRVGSLLPETSHPGGGYAARDYAGRKVAMTALAFRELAQTVRKTSGEGRNAEDISSVYALAANSVCASCSSRALCWEKNYASTMDALNHATRSALEHGKISQNDLPNHFNCQKLEDYTAAVNRELNLYFGRLRYRSRLSDSVGAALERYENIADVLYSLSDGITGDPAAIKRIERRFKAYLRGANINAAVSVYRTGGGRLRAEITGSGTNELARDKSWLDKLSAVAEVRLCAAPPDKSGRIVLMEAEPLSVSVGLASARKTPGAPCGDRGTYFKTDDGVIYIILADGMGTGEFAAECSGSVVHILERFLRSGMTPETSLKILNDVMLLQNETDTVSAAVDLMGIDLFSGETVMLKYGAAPTYVRDGMEVRITSCGNLAAGLNYDGEKERGSEPLSLGPGSIAVMISDGILPDGDDTWLRSLILSFHGDSPKELAGEIVETARSRFGGGDDMTALTVSVQKRA